MKVDYDLYYKDSGSVNKGNYIESNESVSISLSHDYTTRIMLRARAVSTYANLIVARKRVPEHVIMLKEIFDKQDSIF